MKIEQLLVQHLYESKEVTLQGIGTFSLRPDVVFPAENEKDFLIPPSGLTFTYNPKATEDEALISYIVAQTRKIRPLASADLDSYLILGRQFINIGKPFIIEGIGTLNINQQGQYELQLGNFVSHKMEPVPGIIKEKNEEAISFASEDKKQGNKKAIMIAAGIAILILAVWGGWYLLGKKNNSTVAENTIPQTNDSAADSKKSVSPPVAPVSNKTDQALTNSIPSTGTAASFKIVFEVTVNRAAAEKRMSSLIKRGHKVIMYTADSITYKLAEPYNLPLSDTTHIKDSLAKWYYPGKARVEL